MSGLTQTIMIMFFVVVYMGLIYGIWYGRFRKTTKRIADAQLSNPPNTSVYRARYGNNTIMGDLYVSKEKIRFEKDSTNAFSITPKDIERVVYNRRSVQFIMKNGQHYLLRYLRPSPEKEGVVSYKNFYGAMYNDQEAQEDLIAELGAFNVQVIKGSTGKESPYYYVAIGCFIFSLVLVVLAVIAKLIFGK